MQVNPNYLDYFDKSHQKRLEESFRREKRKQPGVVFPSAYKQQHLLLIRFNISHHVAEKTDIEFVRLGLMRLCSYLERIDDGKIRMDDLTEDGDLRNVPLSEFNFSATVGFGMGFFEKLKVASRNRPKKLKEMPNHIELGDPRPYRLLQTDIMIQLGSTIEEVNRWVFQNSTDNTTTVDNTNFPRADQSKKLTFSQATQGPDLDIYSTISDWASVTDIHSGFQRIDGRNLLGFNDGISNPKRLSNSVVWIDLADGNQKFRDGTYMVFQKIEHDLDMWRNMSIEKQEQWVGRSKGTGLLLGTLPRDVDRKLTSDLHSENPTVRERAKKVWKKLYDEQKDPDKRFFDIDKVQYREIQIQCPIWSHVRKSNPRQADGAAKSLIFRRGYLFAEEGSNGSYNSGLLFISFQKDVEMGFEYIKKNFLNNKNFPVPKQRKNFNKYELAKRNRSASSAVSGMDKADLEFRFSNSASTLETFEPAAYNTGREGLTGPSELGVYPNGQVPITIALGGGYYFIPPIPGKRISGISEQFFD